MIQAFFGFKVLQPNSCCPINSLFWDWMFSLYPDNDYSAARFSGFGRAYTRFLTQEPHFAAEYSAWITRNKDWLVHTAGEQASRRVQLVDVKWCCALTQALIKESLSCVSSSVLTMCCSRSTDQRASRDSLSLPQITRPRATLTSVLPFTHATRSASSTDWAVCCTCRTRSICSGISPGYSWRTRLSQACFPTVRPGAPSRSWPPLLCRWSRG